MSNWETSETPFPGGNDITNGTLGGGGFTVTGGNSAPTITSLGAATVDENQTAAIDVQATDDVDSEGSGLTYTKTGGADQALFDVDASTGVVTFMVAPVTVEWETIGPGTTPGFATEDVDYVGATGTVTFAPGETTQMVPITVNGDDDAEPMFSFGGEWGLIWFFDPSPNASIDTSLFFGFGIFVIVDDELR